MAEETVTITVPEEQVEPPKTHEVDQIGKVKCLKCNRILDTLDQYTQHEISEHPPENVLPDFLGDKVEEKKEEKPQRDEKGHFLPGNTVSVGNEGGNKCEFCERPLEIIQKVNLYREWCRGNVDGKQHIPYIEELVSEDYLDITYDQFEDWVNSEKHKQQHAELARTYKKLFTRQKLYLLKATMRKETSAGARFQLAANHNVIPISKEYQAGDRDNPIEYRINIVSKKKREETDE